MPPASLYQLDHIPAGLLECSATALYQHLPGPTLIHLKGEREQPVFVSVLQHGNESTGWEAVRRLLKTRYQSKPLPRSLCLFIGNVEAARYQRRRLDGQPDFNRCWPGGERPAEDADGSYQKLFADLMERMRDLNPLASIDIHNNTGMNPHYAAVNRMENRFFHLASRFSKTVIYFQIPRGVQSNAFAELCPAVTLECGQAGNVHGTDHSMQYLDEILNLESISDEPLPSDQLDLFHMVATVTIPDHISFGFGGNDTDIVFDPALDHHNFKELAPHTVLGTHRTNGTNPIRAIDLAGTDVTEVYFNSQAAQIATRRRLMPSMLTVDDRVIRQDCLCYLMERLDADLLRRQVAEPLPEPGVLAGDDLVE